MTVTITKLTDVDLLREVNEATTGKPSSMSLETAYHRQHSNIRTQLFKVKMRNIPLCAASHLVRHTQGVYWYQLSRRPDRGGKDFRQECKELANAIWANRDDEAELAQLLGDLTDFFPEEFDRHAPTDLFGLVNAEALMNMARKRLCTKASPETRQVMQEIKKAVAAVDPALAEHLVPTCIYRGGICPEPNSCGYHNLTASKDNKQ